MIRALSCLRPSAANFQHSLVRYVNAVVSQHASSYEQQSSALESSSLSVRTESPPLQCSQLSLQQQGDPHIASDQQQDDPHIASDQQQDDLHIASDQQQDDSRSAESVSSITSDLQQPLWVLKQKKMGPVAVAVSGGVDSAVAAMLLKQAG